MQYQRVDNRVTLRVETRIGFIERSAADVEYQKYEVQSYLTLCNAMQCSKWSVIYTVCLVLNALST